MHTNKSIDLNIDLEDIRNQEQYRELWTKIGKIEIKCVEKNEGCNPKGTVWEMKKSCS
jgi:hypothetical protein